MKVLIVDDDTFVAQSLATILSVEPDVEVVGLGASGPEAVEGYRRLRPDVLMPGGDGLGAAETILNEDREARIVFLTTFADDEYIVRALRMGARGYLMKQDVARIAPALRSVMAGVCVLEGDVLERSAAMGLGRRPGRVPRSPVFSPLTEREYQVVEAVAQGLDNAEVADQLFMSAGTVRNHVSSILAKLGLRNRTQVAVLYYRSAQSG